MLINVLKYSVEYTYYIDQRFTLCWFILLHFIKFHLNSSKTYFDHFEYKSVELETRNSWTSSFPPRGLCRLTVKVFTRTGKLWRTLARNKVVCFFSCSPRELQMCPNSSFSPEISEVRKWFNTASESLNRSNGPVSVSSTEKKNIIHNSKVEILDIVELKDAFPQKVFVYL